MHPALPRYPQTISRRTRSIAVCLLTFALALMPNIATAQENEIQVQRLKRPTVETANQHYVGNRAPLQRTPLVKLPVGAVRPDGWIKVAMQRQVDGLTGHLDEISVWLQKDGNAWLSKDGKGEWGWEEVPYWLKGYAVIGYMLDDQDIIDEAKVWLNGAIASQRTDGNFGPDRRFDDDGSQDFWANMVMLDCLRAYYEQSGDQRVLETMTRYFRYQLGVPDELFLTHYWQKMRGGDNMASVYWLYNRTGDKFLLELAEKIHRNTANWAMENDLPNWHNVNIAQGFREPAQFAQQSKDPSLTEATYRNFEHIRKLYGQVPGGLFGADENARQGYDDPRQGYETCGIVEHLLSDEMLLCITGDPFWAEHIEQVAFNQAPASFMPNYRALRYFVAPNQLTSDAKNHSPGIANPGPFFMMNPLSHRCCQHNHSHMWTNVTQYIFTATNDNGLCVSTYIPSHVTAKVADGQEVKIQMATQYPFRDTVDLTIDCDSKVAFPLMFRLPEWCDQPSIKINEQSIDIPSGDGNFVSINRSWSSGDKVQLTFPMATVVKRWPGNHDSASVHYGPLTFSLDLKPTVTQVPGDKSTVWDALWLDDVDLDQWCAYDVYPTTDWNYALAMKPDQENQLQQLQVHQEPWPEDDYPFAAGSAPLRLTVSAKKVPQWKEDAFHLIAVLQDSPVKTDQPVETVNLIPMGAATIRVSAFPVAAEGDQEATQWEEPTTLDYEASASHCFEGDWVGAIADGVLPESSDDLTVPRMTFWDHQGTAEWLKAEFDSPRTVDSIGVYWYDDTGRGATRPPKNWSLSYLKDNGEWEKVDAKTFPTEIDQLNQVDFSPVTTKALRIDLQSQPNLTSGVLEWKIGK